ncbi:MAG: alpha/beta fold hydrolase [Kiritimatiellae bacterium]|nr:alpha/beta fold hydrolase [Kiritimatiellia bacterium]
MNLWAAIPLAWFGGDLSHSLWIAARHARWERAQLRGPDGLRAGAQPFDCGDGDTAVLCIHGFADIPAVFRPMATLLTGAGNIRCRAMRLPGAGEPLAAAATVTLDDWLTAIRAEAVALRRRHGRVWLAGHSLGAALALATAIREPELADGVALLAPLLRVSRARSLLLPPRWWFELARTGCLFSRSFESCFSSEVVAAEGSVYRRDRFIPFATYRNMFALLDWLRPRARELAVPLFARLCGRDRVVDTPAAGRWLADAAAARRDVRVLPDAAHDIPSQPEWKEVTEALRSYILTPCRLPSSV